MEFTKSLREKPDSDVRYSFKAQVNNPGDNTTAINITIESGIEIPRAVFQGIVQHLMNKFGNGYKRSKIRFDKALTGIQKGDLDYSPCEALDKQALFTVRPPLGRNEAQSKDLGKESFDILKGFFDEIDDIPALTNKAHDALGRLDTFANYFRRI